MSLFLRVFNSLEFKKEQLPKKKLKLFKKFFKKSSEVVILVDLQKSGVIVASTLKSVKFFGCSSQQTFHKYNYENLLPTRQKHLNLLTQTVFINLIQETINGKNEHKYIYHQTVYQKPVCTRAYYTPIIINGRLHLQCLLKEPEHEQNTWKQENQPILTKSKSTPPQDFKKKIEEMEKENNIKTKRGHSMGMERIRHTDTDDETETENEQIDIKTEFEMFFENINALIHSPKENKSKTNGKRQLQNFQTHFNTYFDEEQIKKRHSIIQKERDQYKQATKAFKKHIKDTSESLDIYLGDVCSQKEKKRKLLNKNFKLKQEIKKLKQKLK
ncbi:hypothetical protein M0812_25025 [Anaeramoeba flamelloides]|uniref:Uncharacterized protein n=1 Tax=Anaeramoeba flamelloides TaxID=1746091 RepID=A0AAV7YLZ4_9EUKA|nr:hypothetical protein M0812_25025 [Anaeramoeba flamelloides]